MHNHLPTGYPHPNHRDIHRVTHMAEHTGED
nr:MAG TPA: DNA repair protein-like protein [Caudoviricetes sp.]